MQKINPHLLALTRVQLHVVTISKAVNLMYNLQGASLEMGSCEELPPLLLDHLRTYF